MGNRDATRDAAGDRDAGEIDDRGDAVRLASWREERRDRRDERRRDARRRAGTSSPYTQTPHPSIALGAVGFDDRQRANELTLKLRVAPVKNRNTTVRGRRYLVFLGFSRGIWTSFPRGMRGLHEIASFGRFEATSPRVGTGQTVCARDRPRVASGNSPKRSTTATVSVGSEARRTDRSDPRRAHPRARDPRASPARVAPSSAAPRPSPIARRLSRAFSRPRVASLASRTFSPFSESSSVSAARRRAREAFWLTDGAQEQAQAGQGQPRA